MKCNIDFKESVEPITGMLEGIARKTYKEKKKDGGILPTVTINNTSYEYVRLRGVKVLFNQLGTPLKIVETPVTREKEIVDEEE